MRGLVVGGGSIGARHLRNLRALEAGELALVEPDEHRRADLCESVRASGFETLDQGLAWCPGYCVIASPTPHHAEQALRSARHGSHLFVEKPLSFSMDGLDALCSELEARHLVSLVGCNMRFHPGPATVERLIRAGMVGRVMAARVITGSYLPGWRPAQDYRESYSASPEWGGAVLDCIHEIDLALWTFGPAGVVAAVTLPADTLGLRTDGLAEILLRHESGVLSSLHLNFVQRDYRRGCQVIGEQGTLYWDWEDGGVRVFGPDGWLAQTLPYPAGWDTNRMYLDEMQHFLDCVRSGASTVNPVPLAMQTLRLALAIRESGGRA